tara:strand:- start:166 stop:384 length:219 start_codon:yes stop_codon:yes gene_type:complete
MIHAFLLVILLGDVEQRGQPMYFRNINDCNYFASRVVKRYGNYNYSSLVPEKHKATAYCKVTYIDKKTPNLY